MNLSTTKLFIDACYNANQVPLLDGVHGIGKSDAIKAVAAKHNAHCEILILSLMDTGDLIGLPRTTSVGGVLTTVWAAPDWYNRICNAALPPVLNTTSLTFANDDVKSFITKKIAKSKTIDRADLNEWYCEFTGIANDSLHVIAQDLIGYTESKQSILGLDEFNRAPADVLNASLQLILDRRLHSHVLPRINGKPTFLIAAVNPADSNYNVSSFDPALLDRFVYGKVDPDAPVWLDWARGNNIHPVIISYIAEHPNRIHMTANIGDGDTSTDPTAVGATPRSWAMLSAFIHQKHTIPEEVVYPIIKGLIGDALAAQFLTYMNSYSKTIKMEDIEKEVTTMIDKGVQLPEIALALNNMIADQENVLVTELAHQLWDKYIAVETPEESMPMMCYLHALDLETATAFLKGKKVDNPEQFYHMFEHYDQPLTGRGLGHKIANKIRGK